MAVSEVTINLFNAIVVDMVKSESGNDPVEMTCFLNIVEEHLKNGADVNYVYNSSTSGYTILIHAIMRKYVDVARKLIEYKANVNARCSKQIPVIIHAIKHCPDLVIDLLDHGADIESHFMGASGETTIRRALIEYAGKFGLDSIKDRLLQVNEGVEEGYTYEIFNIKAYKKELEREKSESRKHYLSSMINLGNKRAVSKVNGVESINDMYDRFPNFTEGVDFFRRQVALHSLSDKGILHMKPSLFIGPPGVGKTRFVKAIADALNLEMHIISCGAISAGWVIGGSSTSWSEGRPGMVLNSMRDGKTCNPIIMLDEIDKLKSDGRFDGFGPLFTLLETHTSSKFVDEAIALPIDCSKVSFIATANDISVISRPILSRFNIIKVTQPDIDQMRGIVPSIYEDILSENKTSWGPRFSSSLTSDVVEQLVSLSPRDVHNKLTDAFGQAALSRHCDIYSLKTEDLSEFKSPNQSIGFLNIK